MFGKDTAKEGKSLQQQAASRYSKMAGDLSDAATPQRNLVSDYYTSIIKGGPEANRVAAPQIAYLKKQYGSASQDIRDRVPRGGAQQRAQMSLTAAQPAARAKVFSDQLQAALERLNQLSQFNTGAAQAATGGVSQSAQNLMGLAERQNQQATAGWSSVLGPVGFALAQKAFGIGGSPATPTPAGTSGVHGTHG